MKIVDQPTAPLDTLGMNSGQGPLTAGNARPCSLSFLWLDGGVVGIAMMGGSK